MRLPCRHMLHFLSDKKLDLFDENLCHKRWLKRLMPADIFTPHDKQPQITQMTYNEKFLKIREITNDISDILATKPTNIFLTYVDLFKKSVELISKDVMFSFEHSMYFFFFNIQI